MDKIMTQEQKDLLLKDLCARLPYGVMAKFGDSNPSKITSITQCIDSNSWFIESEGESDGMSCQIDNVKPYLFPLSSMTEEQKEELDKYFDMDTKSLLDGYKNGLRCPHTYFIVQDWYNKNHFDYRGLIPMGLANDATGKNIY